MARAKIKITPHPKPSGISRKQSCCQKCKLPTYGHPKENCQARPKFQAEPQQITPVPPPPGAVVGGPSRPKLMNEQSRIRKDTTTPRSHNFDGARSAEGSEQQQVQRSTAAPPSSNNPWSLHGKDEQIMKEVTELNWEGNYLDLLEWATGTGV
ncbi:hypothetical protein M422DRAFT_786133 [Sphaerobolus stellatus SS14]|uniref:Uncharacterized protein n=1 Tax=Sphaerobolus stellatus (strain SS14) TaxID=990650 RepID=A0A0C9UEE5_SPHS4|nr:hypothetical protein M422DRAFT_786133 [Sphaerobolus stellatus SS14]